jgi:hypothetical protein
LHCSVGEISKIEILAGREAPRETIMTPAVAATIFQTAIAQQLQPFAGKIIK